METPRKMEIYSWEGRETLSSHWDENLKQEASPVLWVRRSFLPSPYSLFFLAFLISLWNLKCLRMWRPHPFIVPLGLIWMLSTPTQIVKSLRNSLPVLKGLLSLCFAFLHRLPHGMSLPTGLCTYCVLLPRPHLSVATALWHAKSPLSLALGLISLER